MTAIEEIKRVIEKMPKDSTYEDIMYEIYFRQKIEAGIKADDEGRVVPDEEIKKRYDLSE